MEDTKNLFLVLLENLNQIKFRLFLKEEALNEPTYWKDLHPEAYDLIISQFY